MRDRDCKLSESLSLPVQQSLAGPANAIMEPEASSNASQLVGSNIDSLYGVIDRDNVHGLNLTVPEDAKETIKPWDERESTEKFAESNVDDQLVVHIPFAQNVRIKSVLLKLGRGEVTPRRLRVYANRANIIDFSEVDDVQPSLNISLLEGETSVTEYPLRMAAFSSINSLSVFFVRNLQIILQPFSRPESCPNEPVCRVTP